MFALVVLGMLLVVMGRGAQSWWQEVTGATQHRHPILFQTTALCVSEAGSGVFPGVPVAMWQQALPDLPPHVTLEMSFKSEKSLFHKTTDKNSTSYSAHPFPVRTQNSVADCNHRNKDLCALGSEGMGWCPTVPSAKPCGAGGSFCSDPLAAAGSEHWS